MFTNTVSLHSPDISQLKPQYRYFEQLTVPKTFEGIPKNPTTRYHLSCDNTAFDSISSHFIAADASMKSTQFYEYVFDNHDQTLLKNKGWLLRRKFSDGKVEWWYKKMKQTSVSTVEYSLFPVDTIPNFNRQDYPVVQCSWITTRFTINDDIWVDACSWFHKGKKYIYNIITVGGKEALDTIQTLCKSTFPVTSKAMACLSIFNNCTLKDITSGIEFQISQSLRCFPPLCEPLPGVNVFGFLSEQELSAIFLEEDDEDDEDSSQITS